MNRNYSGSTRETKNLDAKHKKLLIICMSLLVPLASFSVVGQVSSSEAGRHIDRRINYTSALSSRVSERDQSERVQTIQKHMPGAKVEFNEYGVTRSITKTDGNIAPSASLTGQDPEITARQFVSRHVSLLGLTPLDIQSMEITDSVKSISGVTHYYFGQSYQGIPVFNGQLQVHVTANGEISMINNAFVADLEQSVKTLTPRVGAKSAVMAAARELNIQLAQEPVVEKQLTGIQETTMIKHSDLSPRSIEAKLVLIQVARGDVALAWNFQFDMQHAAPDITVDATTGELITSFDLMSDATYKVYEAPVESPIHLSPLPPVDARKLVVNPEDAMASPSGWFRSGTQLMEGNNAKACADRNGDNQCDSGRPQCSGLVCDFPLNLSNNPANSLDAAVANLFYWNNLIHDIQYKYGFDEAGGNFQENNFGRGGRASDSVNADAHDAIQRGANCNANFSTPPDGQNPRMQMFLCNEANPRRDGDFDNGVIVHEYGHGISTRQVGGPGNSRCLANRQQGGEGWSDWFALVYTAKASDKASDARGIASYLFGKAADQSIRPQRYSTSQSINNYTYESINGLSVPHGVGSVWAQALWEVYWTLVDEHGFEQDLSGFDINNADEAGNRRSLFYVNEGLKNTSCSPTFVDARNGIIAAVTNSFGGEDLCRVWGAFAKFGLGANALSGGADSTRPTNGFALPAVCANAPKPTTNAMSFSGSAPTTIPRTSSQSFSITYSATTARDILVVMFTEDWKYLASAKKSVSAGSGAETMTVNLPNPPSAGEVFRMKLENRPVGGAWNAPGVVQSSVTVTTR